MQVITKADSNNDAAANEAAQAALDGFASVDDPEFKPAAKAEVVVEKTEVDKAAEAKAAQEAAARDAAEKEWDGVPVKVRQTLEAISGKVGTLDKIEHRLKGVEGRTGAALEGVHTLKSLMDSAKAATTAAGGAAPTKEQLAEAATSEEKWTALMESMGDEWKEAFDERQAAQAAKFAKLIPPPVDVAGVETRLTGTMADIVAKATSDAKAEARELAKVDRKYENWEDDIYSDPVARTLKPEFVAWEEKQPPEIRALAASNRANDAIKMLDAYYAHRKAVADATAKANRNKTVLERAITPKGVATASGSQHLTEEEAKAIGFASVDNT